MTITGETTTGGPIARDHRRGPLEEQGSIGYRHDHLLGLDFQTVEDLRDALDAMPRASA